MIVQESEWLNEFASSMFLKGCSNVVFETRSVVEYPILHATSVIEML